MVAVILSTGLCRRCEYTVKMGSATPLDETEIGLRLKEARRLMRISQPAIADALGISRERWASYEHGRAPIRFGIADEFCSTFSVSQIWLAEGVGPITPYQILNAMEMPPGVERLPFSEVYFTFLKPLTSDREFTTWSIPSEKDINALIEKCSIKNSKRHPLTEIMTGALQMSILDLAHRLPLGLHSDFFEHVMKSLGEFRADHEREITSGRIFLANDLSSARLHSMPKGKSKSLWSDLLARLTRLTSGRGGKSLLASEVGITRQAVSKWFSGKGEPSAEIALKAAAWADREEKKSRKK